MKHDAKSNSCSTWTTWLTVALLGGCGGLPPCEGLGCRDAVAALEARYPGGAPRGPDAGTSALAWAHGLEAACEAGEDDAALEACRLHARFWLEVDRSAAEGSSHTVDIWTGSSLPSADPRDDRARAEREAIRSFGRLRARLEARLARAEALAASGSADDALPVLEAMATEFADTPLGIRASDARRSAERMARLDAVRAEPAIESRLNGLCALRAEGVEPDALAAEVWATRSALDPAAERNFLDGTGASCLRGTVFEPQASARVREIDLLIARAAEGADRFGTLCAFRAAHAASAEAAAVVDEAWNAISEAPPREALTWLAGSTGAACFAGTARETQRAALVSQLLARALSGTWSPELRAAFEATRSSSWSPADGALICARGAAAVRGVGRSERSDALEWYVNSFGACAEAAGARAEQTRLAEEEAATSSDPGIIYAFVRSHPERSPRTLRRRAVTLLEGRGPALTEADVAAFAEVFPGDDAIAALRARIPDPCDACRTRVTGECAGLGLGDQPALCRQLVDAECTGVCR
jgi:hypothetical protein